MMHWLEYIIIKYVQYVEVLGLQKFNIHPINTLTAVVWCMIQFSSRFLKRCFLVAIMIVIPQNTCNQMTNYFINYLQNVVRLQNVQASS